ncbi:MAG: GTP-binding protein [Verrucomicrobia bacterium]|nr:GTP-binding protein [Verrucomicrobiota bacterium]MBI3871109.1 GTP-binding protein [Verrucomicrobiota bacterium]
MRTPLIPVSVLTGFLGAGKTTLLNRVLTENHGRRIAVIENEYGEIGIDNELVINADEEVFEMNNGCVCCTVRGDLIRILGNLARRRDRFDYVLIETTGLADPGPVAQTFFVDQDVRESYRLDGIITVVDAKHAWLHLDESRECQEQVAFADRILLNKIDLVGPGDLDRLERKIRGMNRVAEIIRSQNSAVDIDRVLNTHAFDLDAKLEHEADFLKVIDADAHDHRHDHEHDSEVTSVGIREERPLDQEKVNAWMSRLLQEKGQDIFRSKGILNIAGVAKRFVFQGVHMQFEGKADRDWRAGETRRSTMVFIGRNLDRHALNEGFRSCLA